MDDWEYVPNVSEAEVGDDSGSDSMGRWSTNSKEDKLVSFWGAMLGLNQSSTTTSTNDLEKSTEVEPEKMLLSSSSNNHETPLGLRVKEPREIYSSSNGERPRLGQPRKEPKVSN